MTGGLSLNPAQRAAVEHGEGPILVLAGAGSGKTRVLTARIAPLIEARRVPTERIFAVTFTNKAAGEMRSRVAALLGADPRGLWIGTFHALSARLLRREAPAIGFTPAFTIYDADDTQSLVKRLLERGGHSPKAYPPRAVHAVISGAKNRLLLPEELGARAESPLERVAADVYAHLGPALRHANAMDFDDLLLHPLTLFREHPERLAAWQRRFLYVLVDEFQDTNRAQYLLVRQLAEQHRNLCVVGDDDQAIYGWRGADVRHMLAFPRDYPDATLIRLEENYRSTQVVLDAANAVIAENRERLGKALFTVKRGGEPVMVYAAADERDEAEWIARSCEKLAHQGDADWDECAVLYRTNAQSRPIEEAFRLRGIPYRLVGAVSFYERREVKDLLAWLRLLANPADDEAFLRAVMAPRRGIGQTSLGTLAQAATQWGWPLLETARVADRVGGLRPNVRTVVQRFVDIVDRLTETAGTGDPATALEAILAATGYEAYLAEEGAEGVDRLDNVRELVAGAAEWAEVADVDADTGEVAGTPIQRYLTQAALVTSADDRETTAGSRVTLMTLHTAKGLEWRVVTVAGLEEGLFPLGRAAGEEGGLEEERRLCYVGLTRARERLYLSWARTRYRFGRLELSDPSRFLESVPRHLIDERSSALRWSGDRTGSVRGHRGQRETGAAVEFPEAEDVSQDAPRYVAGERVRHRKFGSGTVQAVSGRGRTLKVTVAFDDAEVGAKQLLVAYAGLEREWESA